MNGPPPPPGTGETASPVNVTDHQNRRFDPAEEWKYRSIPREQVVTYTEEKEYYQLNYACPLERKIRVDKRSMAVVVSGVCPNSGTPTARPAWCVWFGPGSRFNAGGRLGPLCPQMKCRAEIEAVSRALDIITTIRARPSEKECLSKDVSRFEVTFLTTSKDLCRVMWKPRTEEQAGGKPVADLDSHKQLRKKMDKMIKDEGGRLQFQFWLRE